MLTVCGKSIKVQGIFPRIGRVLGDTYIRVDDPSAVVRGLKESGARVDLFTFTELMPQTDPQAGYAVEWEEWAVIEVDTYDHWWTKQIDNKTRNMVRKAEKKGIVVRQVPFDDALVKGIWGIYNECPVRQAKPNRHYGTDEATVRRLEATFVEDSVFVGAFFEEQLIGFAKIVIDRKLKQAKVMSIIAMVRHWEKAPMNALVAEAVRICAERGIPYCVYGNFTYGKKENDTLTKFKANNGFRPVRIPRYYVPLTAIGSVALRFGLHHNLRDRLPQAFVSKARSLRSKYYGRAQRMFRTAS